MSPFQRAGPALAALALASCVTTNLAQWRDPTYRPTPVHRILVVGNNPEWRKRVNFENAVAQALLRQGFDVATSGAILKPDEIDDQKIDAFVKEMNVDLVMVVGPFYFVVGYQDGFPSVVVTGEATVYAAKTNPESLIWKGDFKTVNATSDQDAAASVAAMVVYDLVKAGVLVGATGA